MKRFLIILSLLPGLANATCELRADTANSNFAIGPFQDSTGAALTALTIEDGDILWKQPDSTTFAEEAGFSDCTHRSNGMYTCPYDATVFDTEGVVNYIVAESGALLVYGECTVKNSDFYDVEYVTGELLNADDLGLVVRRADITTLNSQTSADVATSIVTDDSWIGNLGWIKDTTTGEINTIRITDIGQTNNNIQWAAGDVEFTIADTDEIWITGLVHPLYALNTYDPPTRAELTSDRNAIQQNDVDIARVSLIDDANVAADNAATIALLEADQGSGSVSYDNQTDSRESMFDRLGTPSDLGGGGTFAANLSDIEGQTDDIGAAGAGLTEAGGTGDQLTAVPYNSAWDGDIQSEATDALNAYDPPTRGELTSDISGLNDPTANEVRDAIMSYVIEDSITFEEAACYMMAALVGRGSFTSGSPDSQVFQDPSATDTRVTIQYGTDEGDRTSVVLSATNCGSN